MMTLVKVNSKKELVQLKNGVIYEVCECEQQMTEEEMKKYLEQNKLKCLMKNDIFSSICKT